MYSSRKQLALRRIAELLKHWNIPKYSSKKKHAVFFDVDGTLSRQDNFASFIRFLALNRIVPSKHAHKIIKAHKNYRMRRWRFKTFIKHVIDTNKLLKGLPYWLLKRMLDLTFEEFGASYYIFTYTLLKKLQAQNFLLIAVSGSPDFILKNFFKIINLRVDYIWSTKYIFKKGLFTGEVDTSVISNKGAFVLNASEGLNIDLSTSIAMGDTGDDISLFSVVKNKVAINPNLELATYCKKHNIPMVVERKDVIAVIREL